LVTYKNKEMIFEHFEQLFYDNFYDNFLFHTHFMFSFSLSDALIFVPKPIFLCIFWLSIKFSYIMVIQITFFIKKKG